MSTQIVTLTVSEILSSMKAWYDIISENTTFSTNHLKSLFAQGTSFPFYTGNSIIPVEPLTSDSRLHAYPAFFNNELIFILIPSAYDNEDTYLSDGGQGILNYITICLIEDIEAPNLYLEEDGNRIPASEAIARMQRWDNHYEDWIEQAMSEADGVYQVLNIPMEDIEGGFDHTAHFALTINGYIGPTPLYKADLVIENNNVVTTDFDDTVAPIPPFKPTGPDAAVNFYLLSQAMLVS